MNPCQHRSEASLSDILRQSGYFDSAGNLRIEFVARDNVMPLAEDMSKAKPPLTIHQVRRFFQHCRAIEAKLRGKDVDLGRRRGRLPSTRRCRR